MELLDLSLDANQLGPEIFNSDEESSSDSEVDFNMPDNTYVVDSISDLLPDLFTGVDPSVDSSIFFDRYLGWLRIHEKHFDNDEKRVIAFQFCLDATALAWFKHKPLYQLT